MSDLINRQEAIDDLRRRDPSQIWDTADIEVWINELPSAEPETLSETDLIELRDRFGNYVEFVVRDMMKKSVSPK